MYYSSIIGTQIGLYGRGIQHGAGQTYRPTFEPIDSIVLSCLGTAKNRAQNMAFFGKYLCVDNVDEISCSHPHIGEYAHEPHILAFSIASFLPQLNLFSCNLPDDDVPCRLFVFTPTAWIEAGNDKK